MLVLDSEEISRYKDEHLNEVGTLTLNESATLYEAYEHAVKTESLEWIYVAEVYVSNDGFFYFYSEKAMKSDFSIIDYIASKCSSIPENVNTLSLKVFLGESKGLPEHELGWVEPIVEVPQERSVPKKDIFAYQEDDEATGLLNEDEFPEFEATVYRLLLENDSKEHLITQKELLVGRSESADIRILGNKSISRRHAKICVDLDKNLMVQDLGSSNGVYVDSVRIGMDPVDISNCSVISFGNSRVRNMGVLTSVA